MRSLSNSDYHLLSFPQPSPSPDSFLYQPLAQISNDFGPRAPAPRGAPPVPRGAPPQDAPNRTTPQGIPYQCGAAEPLCRTPHEYSTAVGLSPHLAAQGVPPHSSGGIPSTGPPCQGGAPPRFITSLPDNSPAFISTLPGDAMMTHRSELNDSNEPPDWVHLSYRIYCILLMQPWSAAVMEFEPVWLYS